MLHVYSRSTVGQRRGVIQNERINKTAMCKENENTSKETDSNEGPGLWTFIILCLAAIALWGITWYFMSCNISSCKESCEWISKAGSFGDMFGCLTCLFTGFSVAGLIITLVQQGKNLIQQGKNLKLQQDELKSIKETQQFKAAQDERLFISGLVDRMVQAKLNLVCDSSIATVHDPLNAYKHGDEVPKLLLDETTEILGCFQDFLRYDIKTTPLHDHFNLYLEKLKAYISVSSKVYYILHQIAEAKYLSCDDKRELCPYVIFNLTPADKQLLNIIFLRDDYKPIHPYFCGYDEDNTFNQLWNSVSSHPYHGNVTQEAVRFFIKCMKANKVC